MRVSLAPKIYPTWFLFLFRLLPLLFPPSNHSTDNEVALQNLQKSTHTQLIPHIVETMSQAIAVV